MDELDLKKFVRDFILEAYEVDYVIWANKVHEDIHHIYGDIWKNTELIYGFTYLIMKVLTIMSSQRHLSLLNETKKEYPVNWKYRLIKKTYQIEELT